MMGKISVNSKLGLKIVSCIIITISPCPSVVPLRLIKMKSEEIMLKKYHNTSMNVEPLQPHIQPLSSDYTTVFIGECHQRLTQKRLIWPFRPLDRTSGSLHLDLKMIHSHHCHSRIYFKKPTS